MTAQLAMRRYATEQGLAPGRTGPYIMATGIAASVLVLARSFGPGLHIMASGKTTRCMGQDNSQLRMEPKSKELR